MSVSKGTLMRIWYNLPERAYKVGFMMFNGYLILIVILFIIFILIYIFFYQIFLIWIVKNIAFKIPKDQREKEYVVNGTAVKTNLIYESNYGRNLFDMYIPENRDDLSPIIVWVHGGGLIGGDKIEIEEYALNLAKLGYQIITMNYELVPKTVYPQPVEQLRELILHLLKNVDKYEFDLENFFIAGDSAGAQIACQFIEEQTTPHYFKKSNKKKDIVLPNINGVLLFCGAFNWLDIATMSNSKLARLISKKVARLYFGSSNWASSEELDRSIIVNHISGKFPPTYITDGNKQSFEKQSKELAHVLDNKKVYVKQRFFDKNILARHEFQFDLNSEAGKIVFDDVIDFLNSHRR